MISLDMDVEFVDGLYIVDASWLEEPVVADSFEDAYEAALEARRRT